MKTLNNPSPQGRRNKQNNSVQHLSLKDVPKTNKSDKTITNTILELLYIVQPQIIPEVDDALPTIICLQCVEDLITTHNFLKTYADSDEKFRQFLKKSIPVKSENTKKTFEDEFVHMAIENINDSVTEAAVDVNIVGQLDAKQIEITETEFCLKEEEIEQYTSFADTIEQLNKDESIIVCANLENDEINDEHEEELVESEYFEFEEEETIEDDEFNVDSLLSANDDV